MEAKIDGARRELSSLFVPLKASQLHWEDCSVLRSLKAPVRISEEEFVKDVVVIGWDVWSCYSFLDGVVCIRLSCSSLLLFILLYVSIVEFSG